MKKRNLIKSVSLVALSSLLVVGTVASLTACSGNSATTLSVYIFCNTSDEATNRSICENWAKEYSEKLGYEIKVDLQISTYKPTYFETLKNLWSGGMSNVADIIYLSPKYVASYAKLGRVMDLSPYLSDDDYANIQGVWSNAINYYGYTKDASSNKSATYSYGQEIVYDSASGGYVTASGGDSVGLYGLPKDYSNFAMGYNKLFFTGDLIEAYQTTYASAARSVISSTERSGAVSTYTGGEAIATYAASGTHYIYDADGNITNGSGEQVTKGQEAPMIAIGIPVTYKPFNFYLYNTYSAALTAGDPCALLTEYLTGGEGFTVTIPGWPGQTFEVTDSGVYDEDAPYDTTLGHIVYTYQEYSALSFACSYYLNTFAWSQSDPLDGQGGRLLESNTWHTIYGGEQYEYDQGCLLYVLPWLASNDADFIDSTLRNVVNSGASVTSASSLASDANKNTKASEFAGSVSEVVEKLNLDGTTRNANVQYGFNSEAFLETYAAYANHGAVWNQNAGAAGDVDTTSDNTGWNWYRMGCSIFYGAGSWDAATRNDESRDFFEFGEMPTPVAESYALYSKTSTPDYDAATLVEYSNGATSKGTGDGANDDSAQRATLSDGCKSYTLDEIHANQLLRQDKWAGRMDSVGFAANGRLAKLSEDSDEYWKAEGAASLIVALTASQDAQVTLTYAGAQLPNFVEQCSEFLYYNSDANDASKAYNDARLAEDSSYVNSFADMITTEDEEVWDTYYAAARAMATASLQSSNSSTTVATYMTSNYPNLKYDSQYADLTLGEFIGESSNNIYTAMKVLRLVAFTYADRDLNIRMQYGLNAVRDSAMYTPEDDWLNELNGAVSTKMLSYSTDMALAYAIDDFYGVGSAGVDGVIAQTYAQSTSYSYYSPAIYAIISGFTAQTSLNSLWVGEEELWNS